MNPHSTRILAPRIVQLQNSVHMRKLNGEKLNEFSQFGNVLYHNGSIHIHVITNDEEFPNI